MKDFNKQVPAIKGGSVDVGRSIAFALQRCYARIVIANIHQNALNKSRRRT